MERLPGTTSEPHTLCICGNAIATIWCEDCDAPMCEACFRPLHHLPKYRNHVNRPLQPRDVPTQDDAPNPPNPPPPRDPLCPAHGLPLELCRRDTKAPLCHKCYFEQKLTQEHCMPIPEAVTEARAQLESARQRADERIAAAQQRDNQLGARQAEARDGCAAAIATSRRGADELRERIASQEGALVARLEQQGSERQQALDAERTRVRAVLSGWSATAAGIDELLAARERNATDFLTDASRLLGAVAERDSDTTLASDTLADTAFCPLVPIALNVNVSFDFDLVDPRQCSARLVDPHSRQIQIRGRTVGGRPLPASAFLVRAGVRGSEEYRLLSASELARNSHGDGDGDAYQLGREFDRAEVLLAPPTGIFRHTADADADAGHDPIRIAGPLDLPLAVEPKIFVIGGYTNTTNTNTVSVFDLQQGAWATEVPPPMKHARHCCGAARYGDAIYVMGGNGALRSTERFDLASSTWTEVASMSSDRSLNGAVVACDSIYAVSHFNSCDTVEAYDPPTDRWRAAPSLPAAVYAPGVAAVGDTVYSLGSCNVPDRNSVFRLDPRAPSWTKVASMNGNRGYFPAVSTQDAIYVMGGYANGYLNTVEKYDVRADRWINLAPMRQARRLSCAALVDDSTIYVMGGYSPQAHQSVEIYDIQRDCWRDGPPMPVGRYGPGAVLLN
eukprot:gnl/Trimastix_PCT/990.p1 GENE.gnl/Trimastix_PCT/990~~gnl/Trimastix_PCT/990.p1  ORF type:complete len:675 (+),score=143.56 gnl/Trimastix_PCT/990:89-2113(+)